MDIATLIGIIGGFGLVIGSIVMGSPLSAFINIPGLAIVVGGTVMATLIMQKLNVVLGAVSVAMNAFLVKTEPPEKVIKLIVDAATKAKKGGILALEGVKIKNRFVARGIRMAVDGVEPAEIIHALQIDRNALTERHETGQNVFRFMGATAPAMGMIGTLIGLVQMLRSMDDPATIGPSMAVALLTTFYGAVIAFLVCNPIADKLAARTSLEKLNMDIAITGIEGITKGTNPRILQDKLHSFLAPKARKSK